MNYRKTPGMPGEVERQVYAEERRHMNEIVRITTKWPAYRTHLAYALLGSAIATCDSFGIDVQAFVDELQRRALDAATYARTRIERALHDASQRQRRALDAATRRRPGGWGA